jgi:hypothetical protein
MEKSISINTSKSKFFRQYLELINPMIKLRGRELDVMAELLYHNNQLKSIPHKQRWQLILNYETKTEIRSKLKLSDASLNNNLSALRKKGILSDSGIVKNFLIYPVDNCKLSFKFDIKDESNAEENI